MKRAFLCVAVLFLCSIPSIAQSIEWIHRIPLMQTGWQYPGEAAVIEDSIRNRLMTVGWRIGTVFRSEDNGTSWQGQYALGTDVVGKYGRIYVAPDGRYLWYGETPWNQKVALVSTDGGTEWRIYTRDTMVFKDGSYRGLENVIPPTHIRAYDTTRTGYVISSDLGSTWRRMPRAPSDTIGWQNDPEIQAAPHLLYFRGKPYQYRFDARTDTTWTETRVDGTARNIVEAGDGVVCTIANTLRIYPSWTDTVYRDVTTWTDSASGETITVSIGGVRLVDDSTVYAYDNRGWIFEIRPRTMHVRCLRPFGAALPMPESGILGRPAFLWASVYGNSSMSIIDIYGRGWCVAEVKNGVVTRVDTVAARTPDVIMNGRIPLTYLGDRGIYMFRITTGSFREIVRTTDLGASWIHTARVESEELEPTFIGTCTSARDVDGTLLIHTTQDHCVIPDDEGAIERTYRLAGIFNMLGMSRQIMLYDRVGTLYRDGDHVLLTGTTLRVYDYKQGRSTSTLLPRKSAFVRGLGTSMLAAGADSLWMTFNNGQEWVYVSQSLTSPTVQPRGQFSDASRTASGVLLAAVRGINYMDTNERRGLVRYGGIGRSTDNGNSWKWVPNLPDSVQFVTRIERVNDSTMLAIAGRVYIDSALYRSNSTFTAEINASSILISTDDGATWSIAARDIRTSVPFGEHEPDICVLDNGVVLASLFSGLPYISTNAGRSWNVLDIPELGQAAVHSFRREESGDVMICTSTGTGYLRLPGITTVAEKPTIQSTRLQLRAQRAEVVTDVPSTVRIVGIDGRIIMQQDVSGGQHHIDLSSLSHGTYGVELLLPTGVERRLYIR